MKKFLELGQLSSKNRRLGQISQIGVLRQMLEIMTVVWYFYPPFVRTWTETQLEEVCAGSSTQPFKGPMCNVCKGTYWHQMERGKNKYKNKMHLLLPQNMEFLHAQHDNLQRAALPAVSCVQATICSHSAATRGDAGGSGW